MDVGIQTVFASHGWDNVSDGQVYREETALALLADELGFDVVWAAEHHFYDYSFCPDNTQWLASIVAKTKNVDVGTAAVIMPWNEPLQVAEKIAMLDHIADGRLRFGMGRGLSRREYSHFRGIEMDESRGRFDEGSMMVQAALETGYIEGDGPFYPQVRTPIRPAPRTVIRRAHLCRCIIRRFGRGRCPPRSRHGHVRRPILDRPHAVDQQVARVAPRIPRHRTSCTADLRLRLLPRRRRRGRRTRPLLHCALSRKRA